jgi:hypothetical protein
MKTYLNREETNQVISLMAMIQQIEGVRSLTGSRLGPIWEEWKSRDFITKEEGKNLKTGVTFMKKFFASVIERLDQKERDKVMKQLMKYDFRIVDDFTLKKIFRDSTDRMKNAVVPRDQFEDICIQIMENNCKDCLKNWCDCRICKIFDDNFVPEGGFNKENCKFSYDKSDLGA